jgi:hypothetical protein
VSAVILDGRRYRAISSTRLGEHFEALAHLASPDVAVECPWVYRAVLTQIRRRKAEARRPERSNAGAAA